MQKATNDSRIDLIKQRLNAAFTLQSLIVHDDSSQHVGHVGAADGGGHFSIEVISNEFENKSAIQRHRMIYAALGDAMHTEIHAISIKAQTSTEANNQSTA